jgi:hypothetical protein
MRDALALLKFAQRPSRPAHGHLTLDAGQGTPGLLPAGLADTQERRAKIWDLGGSLHCSIIGTCLTTGELRVLAAKYGPTNARTSTDHEIHGMVVLAISERGRLAKQIQKALDRRHATWVRRVGKMTADELGRACDEALHAGDVPGAYWATLTHPAASGDLVRRIFGDVHMLSPLVGQRTGPISATCSSLRRRRLGLRPSWPANRPACAMRSRPAMPRSASCATCYRRG